MGNGDSAGPRLLGAEAALRVVAEQLPKIVPNVLINKRDGKNGLRCLCRKNGSWPCLGLHALLDLTLLSVCAPLCACGPARVVHEERHPLHPTCGLYSTCCVLPCGNQDPMQSLKEWVAV